MKTIGTVTANPSIDQHISIDKLVKDDALRARAARRDPGGKGINVSMAVQELGGRTVAFGVSGGCGGYMLKSLMAEKKILFETVELPEETRINVILTDLSDRTQTRISAPGPRMSLTAVDALVEMILAYAPLPEWWALGGSLPPGVPGDFYARLVSRLQAKGARCALDADGEMLELGVQAKPFLIKPNEYEFARLTGRTFADEPSMGRAARELVAGGVGMVALTLGHNGALLVTRDIALRATCPPVEVRSKVGAGDSFVAGLLSALSDGRPIEEALRMGMAAGTAAVMNDGTQLCSRGDVERLLSQVRIEPLDLPSGQAPATIIRASVRDVVCGMEIDPALASFSAMFRGQEHRFCSLKCRDSFEREPERYLRPRWPEARR